MMHDLPTPAPSSDAPMPGSSPTKPMRHAKGLASAMHRAFPSKPFSALDLNTVDFRTKAFQEDRAQNGATPPPSSPTLSAALTSSPVVSLRQSWGASPTKQQRVPSIAARPSLPRTVFADASQLDLSAKRSFNAQVLGLTPNLEADSEPNAVPHLLFASRTICLVIGRCKPVNNAHAYNGTSGTGMARQQDQDVPSSTQGLGAKQILRVDLPNEARHVSRVHAIVEWIPFVAPLSAAKRIGVMKPDTSTGTFVVRIVGQNGLIVDGKRRREGQVLRLTPGRSIIDFFGVKCRFEYVATKADRPGASPVKVVGIQQGQSPVKRVSAAMPKIHEQLPSSPPPTSSPPAFGSPSKSLTQTQHSGAVLDNFQDEDVEYEDERASSPTPAHRRADELTAGPLPLQSNRDETADEDEDDESDDEDFVPMNKPQASPLPAVEMDQDEDESESSDLDAAVVDASTLAQDSAAPPATSRAESVVPETLTESQTRMPPPSALPAAVRNAARRSASNSPAPASTPLSTASVQELQDTARRCVRQLAATYDLAGLLAGAIVFHRTATISASEAVRSVLATTPGLMKGEAGEHAVAFSPTKRKLPGAATLQKGLVVEGWPINGDERWNSIARKAWREHLEVALQSSPMFGVISRAGKDASGNPLEFWYYYDKENDPDKERAENLGVFAKPMRKALKGQKPIFWKRSGYPSHQQDDVVEPKPFAPPQEQESLDIATEALPSSSIAASRKRKALSQTQHTQGDDGEELKREKLRAKIAKSGLWDETQPEEKEEPTWDRKGDQDYGKSRR